MKGSHLVGWSVLGWLCAAPALADWTEIRLHRIDADGTGPEIGLVEATDSWFTTLATLMFDISGLSPGDYRVWLHAVPDCGPAEIDGIVLAGHAAGPVYDRDDMNYGAVRGELGEIVVTPDGEVTRTLSIKPPELVAGVEKLTVTEMRGRALVIHNAGNGPDTRVACGIVPPVGDGGK